jgi:hypothetical protein
LKPIRHATYHRRGLVKTFPELLCGLLVLLCGSKALYAVQITAEELKKYGYAYHLHRVEPRGTVTQFRELPPVEAPFPDECRATYGHATFTLKDQTGSLAVDLLGRCRATWHHASLGVDHDN